ncbi:MAG: S-layer family protein, partial [Okeania sp. SIO2D1]|nr:S-layer family protein [Okeania sp. SIO2D1]
NAQQATAGRVRITAQGIFGTEFRPFITPESDITATSELGAEFNGVVDIDLLAINPSSGLVELPTKVSDPSQKIVAGCPGYTENQYIITGRGGLPKNPTATISGETIWQDLQDFSGSSQINSDIQVFPSTQLEPKSIVQATGWQINEKGKVTLVTQLPEGNYQENQHQAC